MLLTTGYLAKAQSSLNLRKIIQLQNNRIVKQPGFYLFSLPEL